MTPGAPWHQCRSLSLEPLSKEDGKLPEENLFRRDRNLKGGKDVRRMCETRGRGGEERRE